MEEVHSHVIIIEDDMLFSPDFLRFFQVMLFLLHTGLSCRRRAAWTAVGERRPEEQVCVPTGSSCAHAEGSNPLVCLIVE